MREDLIAFLKDDISGSAPEDARILASAIMQRGEAQAILYYGSGLWKECAEDTVHDFYVLTSRLRYFEKSPFASFAGYLMPPNVYYMEIKHEGRMLRCKYALMRMDQFERAARVGILSQHIWARFSQPCRAIFIFDEKVRRRICEILSECILSFHRHALSLAPEKAQPREIWTMGLLETYAAELRSEHPDRLNDLYDAAAWNYEMRTAFALKIIPDVVRGSFFYPVYVRILRPLRKFVSLARLIKTAFTFEGAVDYALWKIERQSGIRVEVNEFQRAHPLIAGWPVLWKLWRKGALK